MRDKKGKNETLLRGSQQEKEKSLPKREEGEKKDRRVKSGKTKTE